MVTEKTRNILDSLLSSVMLSDFARRLFKNYWNIVVDLNFRFQSIFKIGGFSVVSIHWVPVLFIFLLVLSHFRVPFLLLVSQLSRQLHYLLLETEKIKLRALSSGVFSCPSSLFTAQAYLHEATYLYFLLLFCLLLFPWGTILTHIEI